MSKVVVLLGVAMLAAGGAAFLAQREANAELRQELALLRSEVRAVAHAAKEVRAPVPGGDAVVVPAGPDRPPVAGEELAKLREEIAALRTSTTKLTQFVQVAQAAQSLAKTSESVPMRLTPVNELANVGQATPESTTKTALWAAVAGDIEALAGTLTFTPSSKLKADAWFASLSEGTRQQYGTPEKVIALMIARDAAALSGVQVLGQKEIGPDDVGLRVRLAANEGKVKDDTFLMHRTVNGWKMVLPDDAVKKFAQELKGGR